MTVLLVRHARAGRRQAWKGDDRQRPLSGRGQMQAKTLATTLPDALGAPRGPVVVLSSPWRRCIDTVHPLAAALRAQIVEQAALGEGSGGEAIELVAGLAPQSAVLCTHGDVVELVLDWLKRNGVDLGGHPSWPKGSTWALESRSGRFHVARYLPPPT